MSDNKNDADELSGQISRLRAQVEVAHIEAVACRLLITQALLTMCRQNDEFRQDLLNSLTVYETPVDEISPVEEAARRRVTEFADLFRR